MMDGVKVYCPLRADMQFIKHGVVYCAPHGIFCRTLIRGPHNSFLLKIANYTSEEERSSNMYDHVMGAAQRINKYKTGVMKFYFNKEISEIEHKAEWM